MPSMDTIFGVGALTTYVQWWQECARAALIFVYGFAVVRITGRRVFGKWAALDIIVSIVIGSNLSRALTGQAPLVGTLAGTTLLMALHWLLAQAAARSPRISKLLEGTMSELMRDGVAKPSTLAREGISEADLNEAVRVAGLAQLSEAQLIALEPSGKISVVKRNEQCLPRP